MKQINSSLPFAARCSLAYFGLFSLAVVADLATTQIGLGMGKTELNPVAASLGAGLASPRMWFLNLAFTLLCTGVLWMAFPRIVSVAPRIGEYLRPAMLHSFRNDADLRSVQYLYSALLALVMRALIPVSNLASVSFGFGLPKAVRTVVGESVGNTTVLIISIALVAVIAATVAVPMTRVAARYLARDSDTAN